MSRYYDKEIAAAQEIVAEVGRKPERTEPRTHQEIESFVRGFGLSAAATARIVAEWEADSQRARDAGWESHADSVYYDQW